MFRQFAVARFMIGFIVFILAYRVASLTYDIVFHFLTAGMFFLSLWVMKEANEGQKEELAKKDQELEQKLAEMQEILNEKEADIEFLHKELIAAQSGNLPE